MRWNWLRTLLEPTSCSATRCSLKVTRLKRFRTWSASTSKPRWVLRRSKPGNCRRQLRISRQRSPSTPTILICSTILAAPAACCRSNRLTHCWLPIPIPLARIKLLRKTILCCGRCLKQKKNSRKLYDSGLTSRNYTWSSAKCTLALHSGQKQKKNFALRQKYSQAMPKPTTDWERHSFNRGEHATAGLRANSQTTFSQICPKRFTL